MSNLINIPSHCVVTIRRPNNTVEVVDYTAATKGMIRIMDPKTLAAANKAMAAAGRGEIISFENVTKQVQRPTPNAAQLAEMQYIREHNAIMRTAAGGERCDQL